MATGTLFVRRKENVKEVVGVLPIGKYKVGKAYNYKAGDTTVFMEVCTYERGYGVHKLKSYYLNADGISLETLKTIKDFKLLGER